MNNKQIASMQVLVVLNLIPDEQRSLVPQDIINRLMKNANGIEMQINYDEYGDVILTKEAKSIIIYLYKNYINKDQLVNEALNARLQQNKQLNQELKESANSVKVKENLFENEKVERVEEKEMVIYSQNVFQKMIHKIKEFLKNF